MYSSRTLKQRKLPGTGGRSEAELLFRVYFARCKSSRSLLYNSVYIVYYTIHITMNTMVNFMLVFKIFFFLMWIIFKVSIEFVTTLLLLLCFGFLTLRHVGS